MRRRRPIIPETEFPKVYRKARIYVALYAVVIGLSIKTGSILPLLLVGFTNLFGTWLLVTYGYTQHAGLAENVLDHRLNCRTVYMCWIHRYLYWNMNYHVEHHMFPLVPYHALPKLHNAVKDDCATPYPSLFSAWREIVPTILKQVRDPGYHVKRQLPPPRLRVNEAARSSHASPDAAGWIEACAAADLKAADVIRFDHGKKTYALYRTQEGALYATDGLCTHGNVHLSKGLVKGDIIECSKHNGRFHLIDGSPARVPICRGLATYPIEERNGRIFINVSRPGGAGARPLKTYQLRVVSNANVATFIKELVLEPLDAREKIAFTPGDYLQLDIPAYDTIRFRDFDIPEPFAEVWERQHIFDLVAHNPEAGKRNNYSLASNQQTDRLLRFNVRIATPPPGQDCAPGVGSSYVFSLEARRYRYCRRTVRGFPYQTHAAGDDLYRRGRGHGSATCPPLSSSGDGADCAQGQLLVRCTIEAGDLLPGVLQRAGGETSATLLSTLRSPPRWLRTGGRAIRGSSTKSCWRSIFAITPMRAPRNIICAVHPS